MRALVFPGQGSQFIGMGKDLCEAFPAAKEVFQEVDDALHQKLSQIIFTGEGGDLNLTENTQPALMAVSVAVARILEEEKPNLFTTAKTKFIAGHSLGEYSALTAGGSLTLTACARLLKIRGTSMQQAVPVGIGAMAAILGLEMEDLIEIVKAASDAKYQVSVANDNSFGQIVISGHKEAVEKAMELAKAKGAKRALPLPVSAPFHCALMQPAAERMREALAAAEIKSPAVPLVANVIAAEVTDPAKIRDLLVQQVTGQVRWRESVIYMKSQGVSKLVELGAGKVLAGLAKRIDKELEGISVGTPQEIESFLKEI